MKSLLITITLAILTAARATPVQRTIIKNPKDIYHRQIINFKKPQTTKTQSNALLANPELNNLEAKAVVENKPRLNELLKSNVTEAKNLNISGIIKKLSGFKDSLDVALEGSKITECIYEGAKSFIVCVLPFAEDYGDHLEIFPFIKCASKAAMDVVNCLLRKSALLHSLRDDIGTNNKTNETSKAKVIQNTMTKMLTDDASLIVDKLRCTYYNLD